MTSFRYTCRRCDWNPGDGDSARAELVDHALGAEHPLCVVCRLSLNLAELQTCTECVATTRQRLAGIVELYAMLPGELGHPTAAPMDAGGAHRDDETPIPGGRALAYLTPGSEGTQWRGQERPTTLDGTPWRTVQRLRHPGTRWSPDPVEQARQAGAIEWEETAHNDNDPRFTPSVAFELSRWEDVWRESRHEAAATVAATVSGAVAYLSPVTGWAGDYHPAFDEFATDVHNLHRGLLEAIGNSQRPQVGVPCFEDGCGADLLREYGEEHYHCPRCRRDYDSRSYWLAVKAELQERARKAAEAKGGPA